MFDVDKFITAVEARPALYDNHHKEYSNRKKKAEMWTEVAKEMYDDWESLLPAQKEAREKILAKKWKAIRDNFVRDYKLAANSETGEPTTKRKYAYFDQLLFLVPNIKSNDAHSSEIPVLVEYNNEIEYNDQSTQRVNRERNNKKSTIFDEEKIQFLSKMVFDEDSGSELPDCKRTKRIAEEQTIVGIALASENLRKTLEESVALRKGDRNGNKAFLMSYAPFMDSLPQKKQMEVRLKIAEIFNSFVMDSVESSKPSDEDRDIS